MRLIDADALKDKCYITVNGTTIGRNNYVMFHEIDNAPTIDAEPVKHGEWGNRNNDGTWATVDFAYCSVCKEPIIHKHTAPLWSFCPNCGAKMKGQEDD